MQSREGNGMFSKKKLHHVLIYQIYTKHSRQILKIAAKQTYVMYNIDNNRYRIKLKIMQLPTILETKTLFKLNNTFQKTNYLFYLVASLSFWPLRGSTILFDQQDVTGKPSAINKLSLDFYQCSTYKYGSITLQMRVDNLGQELNTVAARNALKSKKVEINWESLTPGRLKLGLV